MASSAEDPLITRNYLHQSTRYAGVLTGVQGAQGEQDGTHLGMHTGTHTLTGLGHTGLQTTGGAHTLAGLQHTGFQSTAGTHTLNGCFTGLQTATGAHTGAQAGAQTGALATQHFGHALATPANISTPNITITRDFFIDERSFLGFLYCACRNLPLAAPCPRRKDLCVPRAFSFVLPKALCFIESAITTGDFSSP